MKKWLLPVACASLLGTIGCVVACSSGSSDSSNTGSGGSAPGAASGSSGLPASGGGNGGAGAAGSQGVGGTGTAGTSATGGSAGTAGSADLPDSGTQAGGSGGGAGISAGGGGGAGSGSGGSGGSSAGTGGVSAGNLKAFIVITSKGTPTPGDLIMIGRIKAYGFSDVTPVTDAAVTAQSVAGADLVVISSSAESAPLKAKLKDVALPVLVIEDAEFSLMGMAMSGDHDANITQVTIVPAGSALVGGETGTVTFSSKPGDLGWAAGTAAATVVIGATMPGNAAHAAIFGYAKGAQMPGMVAPGKRAGFAIREALAANLNADGIKLFDAILAWVLQ